MERKDIEALAGIALFYVLLEALGVTCPILFLTGVSCAGCGMSRAWMALLRLDIAAAFGYHPLFWVPVLAALLLAFRRRLPGRVYRTGLRLCGGLFLIVYVIRLILPGDIVVFTPQDGLIWQVLSHGLGGTVQGAFEGRSMRACR